MRIGVTGHSNLTADSEPLIAEAIRERLRDRAPGGLVGVTCLARGADQVFAEVICELGGAVEVVLPAADYRARKVKPDNAARFDRLLGRASSVHTMPFDTSSSAAYMAASERLLDGVDEVIAVWDGRPSAGSGGTADVVIAARQRGLPVSVVWPTGAGRA
ncbi:hypothetical protein FHR81_003210 [Actinoalloteichus hoggarensis]|uniref:Uncharacterized protein n=1 Tax=Actinoalloteichus hoggarensis TaxID=1470176 RepID=A0A221W7G0_9PSEU|nr:hypothetical protein [Actinoalloteichus hoggarensis]ASO21566.1 hypothetical protein AHOG_19740 [Actinoalloteichus hoggarensis]MBB5922158.1 hypothetical protein [Actinoalloteichus hoggarensis]